MIALLPLFFAVVLTCVLIPPFMVVGRQLEIVDHPGGRRVHSEITPRTGGIAVFLGTMLPLWFVLGDQSIVRAISVGGSMVFLLGLLDDLYDLPYHVKFLVQLLAAAATVWLSGLHFDRILRLSVDCQLSCGWLGAPLTVFFLVATMNCINLADGLDGLASGICLLIFSAATLLGYVHHDATVVVVCLAIAGALVGFLRFNTHPAEIFLGDTGSLFLGYLTGVVMLLLVRSNSVHSPILVLYLLGLPILDTAVVMIERAIEHRPLFQPDQRHLHHKLMRLGLDHRQAVVIVYIVQMALIAVGLGLRGLSDLAFLAVYVGCVALILAVLFVFISHQERNGRGRGAKGQNGNGGSAMVNGRVMIVTRDSLARASFWLLFASMWLLFLAAPLWGRPISPNIGFWALAFLLALAGARFFNISYIEALTKLAAYFIGCYYIVALSLAAAALWAPEKARLINMIFLGMGCAYCLHVITSTRHLPIVPLDYLLLGLVVLTCFLPRQTLELYHLHAIAAKILCLFLSLELILFRMTRQQDLVTVCVASSLGLTAVLSFWPWVI